MDELYLRLAALARRFGAKRLVLFGSRARGDNRPNSDIDLAVYGMPPDNRAEFWMECEDLPTLLKFDIVHMQDGMNPAFVANIEKDGVELMDKLHEKYNYLKEAVKRLREALDDYKKYPLDSVRDGAIQRFEFCTELAWKTMREYLLDQGYTNINSPKEVIKQAFAFGMIEDSKVWLELLNDRNLDLLYEMIGERVAPGKESYCFLFHGMYDVPVKGTDKEWQEGSEEVYNYLLCAVGPLEGEYEPGLPEAGFLYPAFRQRSTACNYINLYETAAYQNLWNLLWK